MAVRPAVLVQERFNRKPPVYKELEDKDLPLQRLYAAERERAAQLLLTQPVSGQVIEWTWSSAMQEVRKIAAWIKAQNWPPGSRIVILSRNSAWWLMADFAIWMAGHVSVPFFPAASTSALTTLFRHCQPVACFLGQYDHPLPFSEEVFRGLQFVSFPNAPADRISTGSIPWTEIAAHQEPLEESPLRDGGEIATIIYTSGTTGQPKGAMHSFQGMSLMGKSMEPAFQGGLPEGDRILSYLPLAHIAERAIVEMNALILPLQIFFTEGQETFLTDLERSHSTVFFSVPRLYIRFQQKVFEKVPEKKLNRLLAIPLIGSLVRKKLLRRLGLDCARIVAGGGAATPVEIIQWYRKMGLNFIEGYGMTETGITHVPLPNAYRLGFVGNASPYAETRISPEGEVQIRGAMNMIGYFRNPELTQEVFTPDGYFRTGDRGEIDKAGRLRLIGRLKEEFKTAKGKFVVPSRIEKLLSLSTLFESVAVFGEGMAFPFALAVLVPEKRITCETPQEPTTIEAELLLLLDQVNAQLEHHECLRFIAISKEPWTTNNGLLTPTLKVRRSAIEQRYAQQFCGWEKMNQKVLWLEGR